ncbi:MAG: YeeE/YedE family protein [Gammaproteobacteria bacterium]|nr:YeeE/YedE family protein [Gammaproteobacteria bacterium]
MNLYTEGGLLGTYYGVLGLVLILALAFGYIAQKKNFCIMGALSDWRHVQESSRFLQWMVAIGVSMVGYALLSIMQQIPGRQAFYLTLQWMWLSTLLGGMILGFGMVLTSGCPNKSLLRLGGGSLKALVVLVVLSIFALMAMQGVLSRFKVEYLDSVRISVGMHAGLGAFLANLFSSPDLTDAMQVALGLILGMGLIFGIKLRLSRHFWRTTYPGFLIGLLIVAMWYITGNVAYISEHKVTLEPFFVASRSGKMENFTFIAPLAGWLDWLQFYSKNGQVVSLGMVGVLGVVGGSWIAHKQDQSFRWEGFTQLRDLIHHLLGASMMGLGGVLALGCTIGEGLSGLSTLSLNALSSTVGMVVGAGLAFRYLDWYLMRSG